jgi:ubiquinone/menaquinone biosynthesis C-methylase UbiE
VRAVSALHAELIERSFSQQVPAFSSGGANGWADNEFDWIFDRLELRPDDRLLDVATGTGAAGRQLAASVAEVVGVDSTGAMLAAGRREAETAGLENVEFVQADAASLPFEDASFDVVVCRFSIHHFQEPAVQMKEMVRCLRPGGRLAFADMVADPDPTIASIQNHIEWLRDPSHTRMLTAEQIVGWLDIAGMKDLSVELRKRRRRLDPWLDQTESNESVGDAVKALLRRELDGGQSTGFEPRSAPGSLSFVQTLASVVASKPRWTPVRSVRQ